MSPELQLPEMCERCARGKGSSPFEKCDFCRKIDFPESILCDLNRSVQTLGGFTCHAFLPRLKSVAPISLRVVGSSPSEEARRIKDAEDYKRILFSEKFKYEKAFVLQKLQKDPDFVSMNLKFHFAWNTVHRRPLFKPENKYFGFVYDTILRCSEVIGGFSTLIWLAPDHVHVYVESDVEESPETLLNRMKEFSEKQILKEFPDLLEGVEQGMGLWDEAYFVETVG